MMKRNRFLDTILTGLLLVTIWSIFMFQASYRLEFKEQISIFLLNADRISWYLSNPGFISAILGDWLTQFYINGKVGATLSILLLVLTLAGLVRFYRITEPKRHVVLLLLMLPVFLEGYFMPFPNYPVSATIGLAVSVWSACALAHIKDSKLAPWIFGVSVPVMFVIAGGHALTLALMLGYVKRRDAATTVICLVAGLIAMMLCGRWYNLTLLQTFIWPVFPRYIVPDTRLLLLQPVLILVVLVVSSLYARIRKIRVKDMVLCFVMIVFNTVFICGSDKELENVVKIGTHAYRNEWKEVKKMASSNEPNYYRKYYWNLCNAREGGLADGLLKGVWGRSSDLLFLSTSRGDPYFSMMYYTDALLEMGDVSQATDCALLAQTVMPGHYSTRMLRRLAEIAIVTGDYDVASKYLNILIRTRNHRAWASDLLDCIAKDDIPEQYLIWRSRTVPNDHFYVQGDIRSSLSIIASELPYNRTAIDYLLCSYLLDKNINTFIRLYDIYYLNALDRIITVPDLYQEALLVNVNSRESLIETVGKYHISEKVVDKYLSVMEARASSSLPENAFVEEIRGTYWHYIMVMSFNNAEK